MKNLNPDEIKHLQDIDSCFGFSDAPTLNKPSLGDLVSEIKELTSNYDNMVREDELYDEIAQSPNDESLKSELESVQKELAAASTKFRTNFDKNTTERFSATNVSMEELRKLMDDTNG